MMKGKKGFTLIELLITVAIIGLLSAVVLVSLNSARRGANDARRKADLKQIANALEMYYDTNSAYPTMVADRCSFDACGGKTGCVSTDWTAANLQIGTWLSTPPRDPVNTATNCYFAESTENTSSLFCIVAYNLQATTAGYYVANNGAGIVTGANLSACPD